MVYKMNYLKITITAPKLLNKFKISQYALYMLKPKNALIHLLLAGNPDSIMQACIL